MDNSEDYVLQVFRRAQIMLEETLKPGASARLLRIGEKLVLARDLGREASHMRRIEGISKSGAVLEWLLARSKRDPEFNLDQFDADVQLLYQSLFAGLSAEPFAAAASADDQTMQDPAVRNLSALPEPDWTSNAHQREALAGASPADVMESDSPSLTDLLDHPMLLTVQRFVDSAALFDQKPEAERATSIAVLKMISKSIVDMARPQNKIIVMSTFQEIAGLMEWIERRGQARGEETEKIITELGRMITAALRETAGGMEHTNGIMDRINEHKAAGAK